ncbi:hypothetical protein QYH69_14305 [Paraburkholderia sp. SARCC-3016]|uniref:hypothetical protein n=1 Tax=Paraburkholderia sp. SARCC-3016 TaxID=3058611 RepID=UPI002808BD51|nr:hypothetical protein [Paraburkholderia sp. SARCC-3016]MDQ7978419.1 hypothetical protein [Paraburkholderia sp. SARCC-3016]
MKALSTAIASALLLLASATSFAQTANGMNNGAAPNAPAMSSADQQNWQHQPAMNSQSQRSDAGIDYGTPANGTYQSGRPMNHGGFTEPTFGHH